MSPVQHPLTIDIGNARQCSPALQDVSILNAPPAADDLSDALSKVSIQQQHTDTTASVKLPTSVYRTIPGSVTTTSVGHTP